MNNLFNYGRDLAEVFIGGYTNSICRRIPEQEAMQIACSVTMIYASNNKPENPIRIILEQKKDEDKNEETKAQKRTRKKEDGKSE